MMNGEGACEALSEAVSLDDKLDDELLSWKVSDRKLLDRSNEGSPVSSRYSSCGESEFDRYCSANSVMGTPSLCGSVGTFQDLHDFDFGPARSFKHGDVGGLENFSLGGKLERKSENNKLFSLGRLGECSKKSDPSAVTRGLEKRNNEESEEGLTARGNGLYFYDEMETSFTDLPDEGGVILWKDGTKSKKMESTSNKSIVSTSTSKFIVKNTSEEAIDEHIINGGVEEGCDSLVGINQVDGVFEGGRYLDERSDGKTSSLLEHSESDGSMYGYGTDEEPTGLPPRGYYHYSQDKKTNSENTLLMTSSVAYGSDDWNDFTQEAMENPQDLFGHNQKEIPGEGPASKFTIESQSIYVPQKQEDTKGLISNDIDVSHDLPMYSKTHSISHIDPLKSQEEDRGFFMKDVVVTSKQAENVNQLKMEGVSRVKEAPLMDVLPRKPEYTISNKTADNLTLGDVSSSSTEDAEEHTPEMPKDHKSYAPQSLPNINIEKREHTTPISLNILEDPQTPPTSSKAEQYELNEFYDEVVYEMEEILLDSSESPAARFTHGRKHHSQASLPSRDGGSTASTSSIDHPHSIPQNPYRIDGIEVIGAKQKKGDVSLGERLVGVKEYTVYKLRVWSGTHHWEVERRYRDFFTLYRRLKTSFANKGWDLPSPWSTVDLESRKYFGNASPDVVSERSILIQECLQSILHSKFSSGLPNSLIWFLSPPKTDPNSPVLNTNSSQSQISSESMPVYSLGQSISLIVEIRPHKSMKQMLEAQHYTCAGCHKYFDEGNTRIWEFVQTLGWGKPRVCEYSGEVFCSYCHINETAILPARVLHLWDFTEYPVSQLAKSYLDSIHDKPMLCVSAVNPFLFLKVPPLQHVINVRKRIGRMLPYVRCSFRRSIYKGVGSRRYILESSDFFALKDLVDLSKGVFAALPVMVETISKKIVNHITDECLICYDVGVPCGARLACDDPSSLIFPFQEGEIERCKSCELVYHKPCFKKTPTCPCGIDFGLRSTRNPNATPNKAAPAPNNLVREHESKSSIGFLSGLLSKASPAKLWRPKDNDTVISMGSLPSSSL